jgi:hypothetical protein
LSQERLIYTNPIKLNTEFYNIGNGKIVIEKRVRSNDKNTNDILKKLSLKLKGRTINKIENLKLLYKNNLMMKSAKSGELNMKIMK